MPSGAADDAVVLILTHVPAKDTAQGQFYETCTGTLLGPQVVLTARHCVSSTPDSLFTCAEDGGVATGSGAAFGADLVPSDSHIFTGATRPSAINPLAFPAAGTAFVHDDGSVICNDDVALIVLDRPLDAGVASIRLDGGIDEVETLSVVGWGATTTAALPLDRQRRDDVGVVDVGPSSTVRIGGALGSNEFIGTESACFGDSGGPAFDAVTGAVVGVISRGSQGSVTATGKGCLGQQHTFMKTAPFASLVMQAFAQAGGEHLLEIVPGPDAGQPDAGTTDASGGDAGSPDGGVSGNGPQPSGCGCSEAPPGALGAVLAALALRKRPRRRAH